MNGERVRTRLCANPWTVLAGTVLLALALWAGVPAHGQTDSADAPGLAAPLLDPLVSAPQEAPGLGVWA